MTKKITPSQFKSKMRQLEQKQKKAINDLNRAITSYNRQVKKVVNDYNTVVRKHNANVRRNRKIINNELRKLNATTTTQTSYTVSSRTMQQYYEDVGRVYHEGVSVTSEQDKILDLIEQEQANSLITENYIEGASCIV